jgi:chromate reductase
MTSEPRIKITCLLGTSRPNSYTGKALAIVADELDNDSDISVSVIDPNDMELSFPGKGSGTGAVSMVESVKAATGLVLATPEYHGSFSAMMKLMIENLGFPSVMAGKPVALLGVAAGRIGAIKSLEQLRGVCSHVGAIVLPGPVSVANVQKAFDADGRVTDPIVEQQVRGVARGLKNYIGQAICPAHSLEALVRGLP